MGVKSVKRGHKVSLDASASNAIARAVDTRKVAAFTIGAAGVLAGAALAFSVTPANTAMAAEEKDSQVVQSDAQKGEPHKHEQQANDKQSSDKQIQKKNVTETPKNQMGGGLPSKKDVEQTKVENPEVEKTQSKQTEEKQSEAGKVEAAQSKLKSAASPFMVLASNVDGDGDDNDEMPPLFPNTDLNFDKPVIKDPEHLTDSEKLEIRKRVSKANNVALDKVTFNNNNQIVINFGQIIPGQDYTDTINLDDAIIKEIDESKITIPSGDDAVPVYNPIGFSDAEFERIKQKLFDDNKNNAQLGLTSKDQIKFDWYSGNTAHWINDGPHRAISSGMAENTITVTIKTDKAYVQFTSNIKKNKLTRVVDIRKDYNLEWTKQKMDGRDTDEGFSWSSDKNTLIYHYDSTKAQKFNTEDVVKYLKATPKDINSGLRTIIGGETLASEGRNGKPQRSNMHYLLDDQNNPTVSLTMGNMSGPYWNGNPAIDNSDRNLDEHNSDAKDYSFGKDAKVNLAAKSGKVYPAHLYLAPYDYSYFKYAVSVHSINLLFVPQPSHDKTKLKASIDEYTTAQVGYKTVPTKSKYYNASDTLRNNYDTALSAANNLYASVKDTAKENLTEQQKADIDNAAIKLNKAYQALNGEDTNKTDLNKDITDQGTAATTQGAAATGTHATDRYKNVANPQFKKSDGTLDTDKNNKAAQAKTAYDEALTEANKVNANQYATQKEVNAAKEKLDKARRALDEFETNKDKLSEIISSDAKVKTGTSGDISTADPAYQNATEDERNKYDEAVKKAQELFADPNASQTDVDLAIENLKNAKKAIDAKATNKAALDAIVLQSHDHDGDKKSVFYENGTYDRYFDGNLPAGLNKEEAKQYASKYDDALAKAKEVINNPKATQAQVDEALNNLKTAEENLHKLKTNSYDLIQVLANNFSGNKLPAYFNAYEESQNGADAAKKTQAGRDFVAYNEAYTEAKTIKQKIDDAKAGTSTYSQQEIDAAKAKLDKARGAIVTYATKPSALQTSADQDDVTKNTTAYKNAQALADKASDTSLTAEEKTKADAAKKIVDEYASALAAAKKVLENKVDKDTNAQGTEITKLDGEGVPSSATFLNGVQKHPENKALQTDVDSALKRLDAARAALSAYATKKDDLRKSVDADADTKQLPQYKNTDSPVFKNNSGDADGAKNTQASAAKTAYDQALNSAKDVLAKQDATQVEVDAALKKLDEARKALDAYNTDFAKLQESVGKNGSPKTGTAEAVEGTVTSDAYRNASNPQFMKADASGNLIPDANRNNAAAQAKKAYDSALAKANELLAKSKDSATPAGEKPTQAQVNAALAELEAARTGLDAYKTNSADLKAETEKSQEEGATGEPAADSFENKVSVKNAKYLLEKLKDSPDSIAYKDAKDKLDAYNAALKSARELVKNAENQTLSKHPTQQEVDEALKALKKAKTDIENDAQFNTDKSSLQNEVEGKDKDGKVITPKFEDTPEFNNAAGSSAAAAYTKALADANTVLNDASATQKQVDDALKALQDAKKAIGQFSTDKSKLRNEVEGKDSDGNIIIPKFNESAEYKNAEAKANATPADEDAKKDLENYTNALNEANSVLNDSSASHSTVDAALKRLQDAKKKITDSNKTDKSKLQDEAAGDDDFRKSPYFIIGSRDDISEYEKALAEAKRVLADPNATQAQVDEALKRLAAAKNKINNPFGRGGNGSGSGVGSGSAAGFETSDSQSALVDKSALQIEVNNAVETNANAAQALAEANRVLADPNATQAQVDVALSKLKAARAALLNGLSGASGHSLAKTGAATGLFAGFAAIFAGLGAAGVASRRRKHSNE